MVRSDLHINFMENMVIILYVFWKYFGEPKTSVSMTDTHTECAVLIFTCLCMLLFLFVFFLRKTGT